MFTFFFCSVEHIWKEFWTNDTISLESKDSSLVGHNKENQEVSSTSESEMQKSGKKTSNLCLIFIEFLSLSLLSDL